MPKHHVLIIEDDRSLSDVLLYNLEQAGYSVSVACDGQDGLVQKETAGAATYRGRPPGDTVVVTVPVFGLVGGCLLLEVGCVVFVV